MTTEELLIFNEKGELTGTIPTPKEFYERDQEEIQYDSMDNALDEHLYYGMDYDDQNRNPTESEINLDNTEIRIYDSSVLEKNKEDTDNQSYKLLISETNRENTENQPEVIEIDNTKSLKDQSEVRITEIEESSVRLSLTEESCLSYNLDLTAEKADEIPQEVTEAVPQEPADADISENVDEGSSEVKVPSLTAGEWDALRDEYNHIRKELKTMDRKSKEYKRLKNRAKNIKKQLESSKS